VEDLEEDTRFDMVQTWCLKEKMKNTALSFVETLIRMVPVLEMMQV
jgi:hypothetical protein